MNKYDITTVVLSYNPKWELLRKTVVSAIQQENLNHQIVISDDGSKYNYFKELETVFKELKFDNYTLVSSEKNVGTCRNMLKGLEKVESIYFKSISPGDYYYSKTILHDWLIYIKRMNVDVCFGETVYYRDEKIISVMRKPQNIGLYDGKYNVKSAYLNYLFLDDAFIGASLIVKTQLMIKYLSSCINFLKYAEDMIFRCMIADGVFVCHYNNPVVWYEYGTGISTNGKSKWVNILKKEKNDTLKYIEKNNNFKGVSKLRFCLGLRIIRFERIKLLKYLVYPELIYWKIKKNKNKTKTLSCSDLDYIKNL